MNRRSACFLAAALAVLSFSGCGLSGPAGGNPGDLGRQFTATVPGSWTAGVQKAGFSGWMEKTFHPDGTAHGSVQVTGRSGSFSMVMPPVKFRSKWRVEGDVVIAYDVRSEFPDLFPPGREYRDRILSVSQDRIVYRPEDGGAREVLERKR